MKWYWTLFSAAYFALAGTLAALEKYHSALGTAGWACAFFVIANASRKDPK